MHISDAAAYGQLSPSHLNWIRSRRSIPSIAARSISATRRRRTTISTGWRSVSPGGRRLLKSIEAIEALAEGIDLPLILCGHSHIPRAVRLSDGRLIVNPGSVGCPAYDDELPYYHKVEAGHPLASYAILEKTAAGWTWQFRTVAYDQMAMSALAAERGRADWAGALATGWVR